MPDSRPTDSAHNEDRDSTYTICGLKFVDVPADDIPGAIDGWLQQSRLTGVGKHVHLVNAYTISLAQSNPHLRAVLSAPNAINLADGTPLVWAARALGLVPRKRRATRGPSIFEKSMRHTPPEPPRHYLLGSSPDTLFTLSERLLGQNPSLRIAGMHSPPFRDLTATEREDMYSTISDSQSDITWVGLGTPKQDFEAAQLASRVGGVSVAVGAAFDFAAGTKAEAPQLLRNSGFEWLFRLATEPKRLWRRYLIGNMRFLVALASNNSRGSQGRIHAIVDECRSHLGDSNVN